MAEASIQTCGECGANIYPEHIESRRAGFHAGKLLCPMCYGDKGGAASAVPGDAAERPAPAETPGGATPDVSFSSARSSKIRTGGSRSAIGAAQAGTIDDSRLTRALRDSGRGATRCRTFHSKLNENAIAYMNDQINEWVDQHGDVEIKFANTTVGVFEGKHADSNLIITVFY